MATTKAPGPAVSPRRWAALLFIGLGQLMIILDATVVNIALPSLQRDLAISDGDRQWIITAYTLAFGSLLLLGGRIADYTGRKRAFLVALFGFAAASALGARRRTSRCCWWPVPCREGSARCSGRPRCRC